MSDPVLFLDCDGCLNNHRPQENNYCGTLSSCVSQFNRILDAIPEAKIVVSSAWRYLILNGSMTLKGFEMLLLTHGVKCYGRVIGHTVADGPIDAEPSHHDPEAWRVAGLKWRKQQVMEWVLKNSVSKFIVIDDLYLDMPEQYFVDGEIGLTELDANNIIERLKDAQ